MAPAPRAGPSARLFEARLAATDAVLHNQDNREHDLLDSDDYYQFEGGLARRGTAAVGRAAARSTTTTIRSPSGRASAPCARRSARIVRGRAANPRWIAGRDAPRLQGRPEIAATVDYLFAFAATARAVDERHFDALYEAYLADEAVRGFIAAHNPAALPRSRRRFREAIDRGLWRPRRNSVRAEVVRRNGDRSSDERGESTGRTARRWAAQGGAAQGAGDQDRGARARDRSYRRGQGQIDRRLRHGLRCIGHGMRVGMVQFVKGAWSTGERAVLARFPDLVTCRAMGEGFTWDTQDRARDIAAARAAWETAKEMIADPSYRWCCSTS